ncbi:alpha/beta hydrolase [Marinomonas sp. 2405UD68-3]|uniref:COG3904 family protein n=1 Tax=Marinomonas sp. 2405UD68-3 TaxID=3391835 RepID=UPI0039C926F9
MMLLRFSRIASHILWGVVMVFFSGCSYQKTSASAPLENLPLTDQIFNAKYSYTAPPDVTYSHDGLSFIIQGNIAYLSGVLGANSSRELKEMIQQYPNVSTLALVDIRGSLDQQETIKTARLIRRLELDTMIVRTGFVVSGGVDLFLGGVDRTIESGAGVGIHSWFDTMGVNPQELNLSDPIHAAYVNFYLEMGIPERFYWFSLTASPPERVYFLSPEEIYDFSLVTF